MPPGKRRARIIEPSAAHNEGVSELHRAWLREGRCPLCGELGAFVAMGAVCSKHGPYEMTPELGRADTPEAWLKEED